MKKWILIAIVALAFAGCEKRGAAPSADSGGADSDSPYDDPVTQEEYDNANEMTEEEQAAYEKAMDAQK